MWKGPASLGMAVEIVVVLAGAVSGKLGELLGKHILHVFVNNLPDGAALGLLAGRSIRPRLLSQKAEPFLKA